MGTPRRFLRRRPRPRRRYTRRTDRLRRVPQRLAEHKKFRASVGFGDEGKAQVTQQQSQRFARRQIMELGGNSVDHVRLDVDLPGCGGNDLLQQPGELAGLYVRADQILVRAPIERIGRRYGPGHEERRRQTKGEQAKAAAKEAVHDSWDNFARFCRLATMAVPLILRGRSSVQKLWKKPIAPTFYFGIFPAPFDPIGHGQHNLRNR